MITDERSLYRIGLVVLSAFLVVLCFALGVQVGDNMALLHERAELEADIQINGEEICRLADRLIWLEDAVTFRTLASYYGETHRGKLMASGVPFDPDELTAASPWLPFGSAWRVTSLRNGRSVRVTITDRGPAVRLGRGLDLSAAAARRLDMIEHGVIPVVMRPEM